MTKIIQVLSLLFVFHFTSGCGAYDDLREAEKKLDEARKEIEEQEKNLKEKEKELERKQKEEGEAIQTMF